MEEVVTGWRKLAVSLWRGSAGIGEALGRWLALPVGYMTSLSVGLGIFLATFDVPRRAPFRASVWPLIGAVMLTFGFDLALAHARQCFPRLRLILRAASATVWVVVIIGFTISDHVVGILFMSYGLRSLRELWTTRRRSSTS